MILPKSTGTKICILAGTKICILVGTKICILASTKICILAGTKLGPGAQHGPPQYRILSGGAVVDQ